jgi:hypothetical protein
LLRARLPADEGALVVSALEATRDALRAGSSDAASPAEVSRTGRDASAEADGAALASIGAEADGATPAAIGAELDGAVASSISPAVSPPVPSPGQLSSEGRGASAEAPADVTRRPGTGSHARTRRHQMPTRCS